CEKWNGIIFTIVFLISNDSICSSNPKYICVINVKSVNPSKVDSPERSVHQFILVFLVKVHDLLFFTYPDSFFPIYQITHWIFKNCIANSYWCKHAYISRYFFWIFNQIILISKFCNTFYCSKPYCTIENKRTNPLTIL